MGNFCFYPIATLPETHHCLGRLVHIEENYAVTTQQQLSAPRNTHDPPASTPNGTVICQLSLGLASDGVHTHIVIQPPPGPSTRGHQV